MRAVVTRPFYVRWGGPIHKAGEVFEGPEAQVAALSAMGLVDASEAESGVVSEEVEQVPTDGAEGRKTATEASQEDYSAMTAAELRALCDERDIDYPKRATKAQLVEYLSE